jgi:hypothetical protein
MFDFAETTKDMSAVEILNYYRNLFYAEPQVTERGIVANAINDILHRMILPPCKLGQTVYVVSRYFTATWEIYECKVDEITVYPKHMFMRMKSIENKVFAEEISQVGKTVFLTREEAEKALEGKV